MRRTFRRKLVASAGFILAAAAPAGAPVKLTTQPGSALEATARLLVATDLREAKASGDTPVLLVGSARLAADPAPAALFVQVQSASFCGSAGCTTTIYVKRNGAWKKVLDSVSGPIKVAPAVHDGMHDLLVHDRDRWVWKGDAYADTMPAPPLDLGRPPG